MAHVLSKINAAHHLKRKLLKEAEGECAKLREWSLRECASCAHSPSRSPIGNV